MASGSPNGSTIIPGNGVNSPVYTQLAFDPRITKPVLLGGPIVTGNAPASGWAPVSGLQHGYIVQAQSQATTDGTLYGLAFLFNPSLVTLQHGIDSNSSLVLPQYRRLTADKGQYVIGLASTLDISLFFDRTYELNTGIFGPKDNQPYTPYSPYGNSGNKSTPEGVAIANNDDPRLVGVLADIRALYRVVGMNVPIPLTDVPNSDGTTYNTSVTGPMQMVPCYVMLSSYMANHAPYWYGYVDSIGITYTHFTQQMVPMRAEVDLEITLLPSQS